MGINFDKFKEFFVEYYKKCDDNISKEKFLEEIYEYIIGKIF